MDFRNLNWRSNPLYTLRVGAYVIGVIAAILAMLLGQSFYCLSFVALLVAYGPDALSYLRKIESKIESVVVPTEVKKVHDPIKPPEA